MRKAGRIMPQASDNQGQLPFAADRRNILKWTTMMASASGLAAAPAPHVVGEQRNRQSAPQRPVGDIRQRMIGFMLGHGQFPVPTLVDLGALASRSGFQTLATSDHLQPWQANQGHSGEAWVTMGALGAQAPASWMGTTVTCPTLRYNPAVVAEAFATLSHLYPGRIFLASGLVRP